MTRTYALLRISEATYLEIKGKLEAAGYQHACCENIDAPASPILHLDGIAVYPEVEMIGTLATLVYVRWFDSSITTGHTCTPEEATGILENESAGLLVAEDKKSITIALDRCIETEGLRCTLCIPKVNVHRIKRIKV